MSNKIHKLQYNALLSAVKLAIEEWNPYGLLPDAPENEFVEESRMVAARIKDGDLIEKISEIVSVIFSQQFKSKHFCVSNCMDVAEKIKLNVNIAHTIR